MSAGARLTWSRASQRGRDMNPMERGGVTAQVQPAAGLAEQRISHQLQIFILLSNIIARLFDYYPNFWKHIHT